MPDRPSPAESAVESVVKQVSGVGRGVRPVAGFRATTGMSPRKMVAWGVLPAMAIFVVGLATQVWILVVAAAVVAIVIVVVLFRVANDVRVVAVTRDELVVFGREQGQLVERGRHPRSVTVVPQRDRNWLEVELGDEVLWVSARLFRGVVEPLAVPAPDAS